MVWVDCTAAAHPLVLRPIIERLRRAATRSSSPPASTGRRSGSSTGSAFRTRRSASTAAPRGWARRWALGARSARLARLVWRQRPQLAIGHGSVDLAVVSAAFRIPSVQMQDYEFARPAAPDRLPRSRAGSSPRLDPARAAAQDRRQGARSWSAIPGLKEDYYLADFEPDPAVLDELGLDREKVLVVLRPPPETSEYHAPNDRLRGDRPPPRRGAEAQAVVDPPHRAAGGGGAGAAAPNLIVPERAIDAQSLIAYADLVVSAGGTMNREAVALGTPVFTTFSGRMGGVDEALIAEGRLQVARRPGGAARCASGRRRSASATPATPRSWSTGARRRRGHE